MNLNDAAYKVCMNQTAAYRLQRKQTRTSYEICDFKLTIHFQLIIQQCANKSGLPHKMQAFTWIIGYSTTSGVNFLSYSLSFTCKMADDENNNSIHIWWTVIPRARNCNALHPHLLYEPSCCFLRNLKAEAQQWSKMLESSSEDTRWTLPDPCMIINNDYMY